MMKFKFIPVVCLLAMSSLAFSTMIAPNVKVVDKPAYQNPNVKKISHPKYTNPNVKRITLPNASHASSNTLYPGDVFQDFKRLVVLNRALSQCKEGSYPLAQMGEKRLAEWKVMGRKAGRCHVHISSLQSGAHGVVDSVVKECRFGREGVRLLTSNQRMQDLLRSYKGDAHAHDTIGRKVMKIDCSVNKA